MTRKEARAEQIHVYFTGESCCNGHVALRATKSSLCLGCYPNFPLSRWLLNEYLPTLSDEVKSNLYRIAP